METSNLHSSPAGKVSAPADRTSIARLRAVCTRIESLAWRARRDMADAMKTALVDKGHPPHEADSFAEAAFHAPPGWSCRSEVLNALARTKIKVSAKRLYAQSRRAFESGIKLVELDVTASGRVLPAGSSMKPVARLLVRRDECVMFKLIMNQNADI